MCSVFPALVQIVRYLNLPIDLHRRGDMTNACRETNETRRTEVRESHKRPSQIIAQATTYAADVVPLEFDNVTFRYASSRHISLGEVSILYYFCSFIDPFIHLSILVLIGDAMRGDTAFSSFWSFAIRYPFRQLAPARLCLTYLWLIWFDIVRSGQTLSDLVRMCF